MNLNQYEECLDFLMKNKESFMDKPLIYEKIVIVALKLNKIDLAFEYITKLLERNSENFLYYLYYFKAKGINQELEKFVDLAKLSTTEENLAFESLKQIKDLKIKSKISERIELFLLKGEQFQEKISAYITYNIKQTNPSIHTAIKCIYDFQKDKIQIITDIILQHISSIEKNQCLDLKLTNNENLDILSHFCWVYYFAALHYDYLRELEKAMYYINIAIDTTPSVIEYFSLKSKILKHAGMLKESCTAYEKVKFILISFL